MSFGQHNEKPDQSNTEQKIGGRNDDRDCAGITINQQDQCSQRATDNLHREHLTAVGDAALQHLQRQPIGARGRMVGAPA